MASENATASPAPNHTTAPVLEYICLFTKDIKKKQKKWQDGRLKYHTYNKKVMVYDERGYTIGCMHWRHDYDLADGEELDLESGGTRVQVCECIGTQEQDISGLVDKRVQEREQRAIKVAARMQQNSSAGGSRPVVRQTSNDHFQTRQVPLNQLLGTPTGHHGRALVPSDSPFEKRQRVSKGETPRPAKRPRREPSPPARSAYAQNLFGEKLYLASRPSSSIWRLSRPTAPVPLSPRRRLVQEGQPVQKTATTIWQEPKAPVVVDLINGDIPAEEESGDIINGEVLETSAEANTQPRELKKADKVTKMRSTSNKTPDMETTLQDDRSLNQPAPKKLRTKESTPSSDSLEILELKSPPTTFSKTAKRKRHVDMKKQRFPDSEPETFPNPEAIPLQPLEDDLGGQPRQKTSLRIMSRQKRGLVMLSSEKTESSSARKPDERSKYRKEPTTKVQSIELESPKEPQIHVLVAKALKKPKQKPSKRHLRPSPALADVSRDATPADQAHIDSPEIQRKEQATSSSQGSKRLFNSVSNASSGLETCDDPVEVVAKSFAPRIGKRRRARHNVIFEEDSDSNDTTQDHARFSETISRVPKDSRNRDVHPDMVGLLFEDDSDVSNDWVPPLPTHQKPTKTSKGRKGQDTTKPAKVPDRVGEGEGSEPPKGQLRLERLGRKGVKSREVIGWVFHQPPAVSFGSRAALPLVSSSQTSQNIVPEHLPNDGSQGRDREFISPLDIPDDVPTSSELAQLIEAPPEISPRKTSHPIMEEATTDSSWQSGLDFIAKTTVDAAPDLVPGAPSNVVVAGNVEFNPGVNTSAAAAMIITSGPSPAIMARPRIANPATRGRKAAVRSDAQGKAPQHVLPTDSNPLPRQGVLQALAAMMAASTNEAAALLPSQMEPPRRAQPERPKIKMKLPGFAPAGASVGDVVGPWSREAYDLLGVGRPSR